MGPQQTSIVGEAGNANINGPETDSIVPQNNNAVVTKKESKKPSSRQT